MDTVALLSKLKAIAPGLILEKGPFGRSEVLAIWIEAESVYSVAHAVRNDPQLQLNWLESMTAAQLDEAIVLTYFIRSHFTPTQLILRSSSVPKNADTEIEVPSVNQVWGMAWPMEAEAAELFGIRFVGSPEASEGVQVHPPKAPKGWSGFPMRKTYIFPKEVFGIPHERAMTVGRADRGGNA